MSARRHFESLGGPNFMTPFPIRYVDTERYMIELSEGHFLDDHLWGVSVADRQGTRDDEKSRLFTSAAGEDLVDAEAYIFALELEDI